MFTALLKNRINHPLQVYIEAIENYLDDDVVLRSIGDRIGIAVPDKEYAYIVLYDGLNKYLLNEEDTKKTEEIINMTFEEYWKTKPELSEEDVNILYSNRLLEKLF